jgi:hypothetical protein
MFRQTLAIHTFRGHPAKSGGSAQDGKRFALNELVCFLFSDRLTIRDLWTGLRQHEAGQPDWS